MKKLTIFIAFAFLLLGFMARAQEAIDLENGSMSIVPDGKISYFQDSAHANQPDELNLKSFKISDQGVLSLDFQKHPVWVYFKAVNKLETSTFYIDIRNPLLDTITVYFRTNGGEWQKNIETGADYPFKSRVISHQHFIIPFDLDEGKQIEILLKVKSNTPVQLPIKIYSKRSVIDQLSSWDYGRGLFYGIMLAMFLYNVFITFVTRDRAYRYYIFYVLFIALTQTVLDGTFEKYIYRIDPDYLQYLLILFPALSGISALQFAKEFMHLKEVSRRSNIGMTAIQVVYAAAIVFALLGFSQIAYRNIDLGGALAASFAFVVSIYLAFKGHRPARLFALAWSFFLISLIIFILRNIGVFEYNTLTENILQIGIASEVILLSFALADRINTLRKEKEESQEEALRVSQENERIIRDQNIVLEKKVNERTLELQEANEELSVTLNNLRETQTQLVDAEKMASLGQLTAGIAHEINNPINFVSSNITPLSRDLDDMYEIIDAYKAVEGDSIEEKLQKAHQLREELDYDYVKDEISELVQGISDGAFRTSEIVKGLRTFSRLDEDTIKEADLKEGINSTLVLLKTKLRDSIKVEEDYDPEAGEIECYPGKLNQVFMNILNNGIYAVTHKNYPEGEVPTLTIKTRKSGDQVSVHFIDNGIGMDEETRKKIFDPFFTTKDVGEGTGLGMSIVYKIIDKHGGSLDVRSELGVGSEFIITLPMRQPKEFE